MANRKTSDLTALTAPATGDLLQIVDISEAAAADKNKKITYGTFLSSAPLGSAAAPTFAFSGYPSTGIYSPGADQLAITTSGTGRLFVNAAGLVDISNTTSDKLTLSYPGFGIGTFGVDSTGSLLFKADEANTQASSIIQFKIDGGEKLRIDSSGRLLVGTSSVTGVQHSAAAGTFDVDPRSQINGLSTPCALLIRTDFPNNESGSLLALAKSRGASVNSNTIVADGDTLGEIGFFGADGTDIRSWGASIQCRVDGTPGVNDMPGRLVFSTTADGAASPTERMRITNDGNVMISSTAYTAARLGIGGYANGDRLGVYMRPSTDPATPFDFRNAANTPVGSIATTVSATAFNTSSDYRLKENVTPITNGITRFQQLKPSQFNFIVEPDKTVEGFLAHEAQAVVPECVTGEKDAVDADGNPVYQGIDQSKLVPLLTAALQEAIARIETLETEVAALKGA